MKKVIIRRAYVARQDDELSVEPDEIVLQTAVKNGRSQIRRSNRDYDYRRPRSGWVPSNILSEVPVGLPVISTRALSIDETGPDLSCLKDGQWLNGNTIELFMQRLCEGRDVHCMGTFFLWTYKNRGYEGVQRWTRKVFTLQLLLLDCIVI